MNMTKKIQENDVFEIIRELRSDLAKYVTEDVIKKDIRTLRDELLQSDRNLGALLEGQDDKVKMLAETMLIQQEISNQKHQEFIEYSKNKTS